MTAQDLIAQHSWTSRGASTLEGSGKRTPVTTEAGKDALLYTYETELTAARCAAAHRTAGEQMFAIPELLESGPGWLLVEQPEGTPMTELGALQGERARPIVESIGSMLRKLHQIPVAPFCGDIADELDGGERWLTFSGYVAHHLEWFNEHLRKRDFEEPDAEALNAATADLRHELSAFHPRNPACLCHGRLAFEHIWVDEAGREVVGLTGFECAAQIPREADIAHLLWIAGVGEDQLIRSFYEGYGAARTMDVQRRERFYRRLVAFQALFEGKGPITMSQERLIALTSPRAL